MNVTFRSLRRKLLMMGAALFLATLPVVASDALPILYAMPEQGKWGHIDRAGKWLIEPRFEWAGDFDGAYASVKVLVESGNQKIIEDRLIDRTGKLVSNESELLGDNPEKCGGLERVRSKGKVGFIDSFGAFVVPAKYMTARPFSEDLAYVTRYGRDKGCFIDKTGKIVIDLLKTKFALSDFHGGFVRVSDPETALEGFMDGSGKLLNSIEYIAASDFSEGLAAVRKKNALTGYINAAGENVIAPQFRVARPFSEGLAAVQRDPAAGFGFIHSSGIWIISERFDDAGAMNEGMARISDGGLWGFVSRAGEVVVDLKYAWVSDFNRGCARVQTGNATDGEYALIDKEGRVLWKPKPVPISVIPSPVSPTVENFPTPSAPIERPSELIDSAKPPTKEFRPPFKPARYR